MQEATATRQHDRVGVVALSVVGAAGALLNLNIVVELARAAGYNQAASWLYWLVLDFFAVIAMRGAFRAETTKVRRWAGCSSVFALLLSAGAAGAHVFIEANELPKELAFAVLCLPALMIGLSLHLVLLMALEGRQRAETADTSPVVPPATIVMREERPSLEVTETVTHQRQVTSRQGTKTARFLARLEELELSAGDPRTDSAIAAEVNQGIGMHATNARQLVAKHLRSKEIGS